MQSWASTWTATSENGLQMDFSHRLVPHRSVAPKRPATQPTCCVPRIADLQGSCSQGVRMPAIGHMHTSSSASGSAGLLAPHGRGPAPFRPHNAPAAAGTTRPRAVPSASPAPQRSAIAQQQRRAMQPARAAAVDVAAPAPTPSAQPAPARPAGNPSAPTFQQAITKLQEYWASVGCAIYLPHNTEVGAGTMNPATFLRVLGPEPWNVAYPEPSIRPDDSRYGDNPNRLQRHTQFQVILKPDPGNSQELYLGSLEALGIDTKAHDVRFVEDNWESPVLGAWGLGWEVWLDGMEVTQFTYFQQAGGKTLDAPAVEITYGMERILMALQGVTNFRDIRYNNTVTYGELFLQNEYEMSRYNLDEADVAEQRTRFELYEKEARRMLEKRLPIPAYDHVLKLSHTFNLLDARGAVGVTERANCFAVMRQLAREVTGLWLARREELGHPLGVVAATPAPVAPRLPASSSASDAPKTFVLEVGTEELPPDDVMSAVEQLQSKVVPLLQRLRLAHGEVKVDATPRRLSVLVTDLAARQTAEEQRVRGPPASAAFSADGKPTKALEGFCRKNGVQVADVSRAADAKGVEYVWVTVKDAGRTAAEALADELPGVVSSLNFKKSMRWAAGGAAFSRPVRWLLAMHGEQVVPFAALGLLAGSETRGLRNSAQPLLQVSSADAYASLLSGAGISLGLQARREAIWAGVTAAASSAGGHVPESARGDLLDEVTNLVESPTVVLGSFSPSFLELPQEVLVMVMRKHQRYFPVFAGKEAGSALLPVFVTVANGPVDKAVVAAGNEAVLRARFEDAAFFYREDLKQKLQEFRPKLSGTMFQKDLGSLLDKSNRVEALTAQLAELTGLQAAAATAKAAAHLAKADLATSTVMEMTALAGTMGRHFAHKQGEAADVAEAIFEAALPRQAGDALPTSSAGLLVAVADRLDSLVGLFAAGCAPTASADQYGLRRAAYGMLQALVSQRVGLSLERAVAATAALQPISVSASVQADVRTYVTGRLEQLLIDGGVPAEAVRAVLAERGDDPALAAATAEQLAAELAAGEGSKLKSVMQALARPTRIARGKGTDAAASRTVDPSRFDCAEERALADALAAATSRLGAGVSVAEFLAVSDELLVPPINAFFDKVFVMCEDEAVRNNRLALLRKVADVSRGIMDLSQLPGF